jgi:hypothetical protein
MKFKSPRELKKWMDKQTDKELLLRATFVLQQWKRIDRLKARGEKLDALSARFFKEDCDRLNQLIEARGDAGVSP